MRSLRIKIHRDRVEVAGEFAREGSPGSSVEPARDISDCRCRLTSKEILVLKFVAEGLTNRQIARQFGASIKTVQKQRQSLMDKLHLHFTAGLVRYAVQQGIVAKDFRNPPVKKRDARSNGAGLSGRITARETEVLKLIADGLVSKQIAALLNISIKTVDNHRQNLMKRLDIHEVAGLTRYAIAKELVPGRPPPGAGFHLAS